MNSIYSIYERLYHGILGDMNDTIDKGEDAAQNVLNTYKEKIIKIATCAAHMSEKESLMFRKMIDEGIDDVGTTMAQCYMDNKIKYYLINLSKRTLTLNDLNIFPTNNKEYGFACSSAHVYLDYQIGTDVGVDGLGDKARKNKGQFVYGNNDVRCIQLGNAIIYQQKGYFYIKFANTYRWVINITDTGSSANKINLNYNSSK